MWEQRQDSGANDSPKSSATRTACGGLDPNSALRTAPQSALRAAPELGPDDQQPDSRGPHHGPLGPLYLSSSRLMLWSRRIPSVSLLHLPALTPPTSNHSVCPSQRPLNCLGLLWSPVFLPQPSRSPDISSSIPQYPSLLYR